jgi:hypothetical protein
MLTRILPNNNRVLALLDANRKLLRKDERGGLELFRQHFDDLQAYHIEGVRLGKGGTRFGDPPSQRRRGNHEQHHKSEQPEQGPWRSGRHGG